MYQLPDNTIEQIILNKFFTDGNYNSLIIDTFDKRLFDNKNIATILSIITTYYKKYDKSPSKDVLELIFKKYCQDHKEISSVELSSELNNSLNINISQDEQFVQENIIEFLKNKSVYYAIFDNIDIIENKKDVSTCITKLEKAINISLNTDIGFDYFDMFDKHIDYLQNPESVTSTGYKQIDSITKGGFPTDGRCLVIFMGQPGIGKSLILGNLAINYIYQDLFPLIISLEMSEDMYCTRIDAGLSNLDIGTINYNIPKLKEKIDSFKLLHSESKLIVKEFPPNSTNCHNIVTYIDKLIKKLKRKPNALLVDYSNLVLPNNKNFNNMYERVGEVSRDLRALSYRYHLPVISATQSNRSGTNNTDPELDSVSESMGLAHTADFFAGIYQKEGDRELGIYNLKILKNRFGGFIGKHLKFHIDYNTLRIKDFTEENKNDTSSQIVSDLGELDNI